MSTETIKVDSPLKKAALIVAAVACILGAFFFAKWGLVNSAVLRVEDADQFAACHAGANAEANTVIIDML